MSRSNKQEIVLRGVAGAPGIAIGKAYFVDKERLQVVDRYTLRPEEITSEVNRFKRAVHAAEAELRRVMEDAPDELAEHIYILETHRALLRDKMFFDRTVQNIERDSVNAEWALKMTVDRLRSVFRQIKDTYLRERSRDVTHVYELVMRDLIGDEHGEIRSIDKKVILIAHDLSPAEVSQIEVNRVKGFVTDVGGGFSHTSIVARTLQIPAVLGVETATRRIRTGDLVIVDGAAGVVIVHPLQETLARYQQAKDRFESFQILIARDSHLPAVTADQVTIQVNGNIDKFEEVETALHNGGDGIGLYRTEFLYLNRLDLPQEEELFDNYRRVAETVAPRPVTIRTLDINGDKVLANMADTAGENPALGLRAIRFCLVRPEILRCQLRAIMRAAAFGNVRLLYPMISGLEELLAVKRIAGEIAEELDKRPGSRPCRLETGVMIEIPSAAIVADVLADHVDFFSFGTNDLIQYTLAVDRGNKEVAHLFQPLHPAIIRILKHVADVARQKNVRLALCGEMAGDPFNAPLLLGLGIEEFSMNSQSIPAVKSVIRCLRYDRCRELVDAAVKESTAKGVAGLIEGAYGSAVMGLKVGPCAEPSMAGASRADGLLSHRSDSPLFLRRDPADPGAIREEMSSNPSLGKRGTW